MPTTEPFTAWRASDWIELMAIWRGLVGDSMKVNGEHSPRFRGKEINNQQAGYVFQTWIIEALRQSHVEVEPPFKIPLNPGIDDRTKHEVDGLLITAGQAFLIEAKFERVDFAPIARLHVLAEGSPAGTMGLLFAAKGFTKPALDAAHVLRPMRVYLFEPDDIEWALRADPPSLSRAVLAKWKAAIMYGTPSLSVAQFEERTTQ